MKESADRKLRPLLYSYGRISTLVQSKGHGRKRQEEDAEKYAKSIRLELYRGFSMFDVGYSGYTGDNIKSGALGRFLELVKAGKIAPGSVLLVENIDRISRMKTIQAFNVITGILSAGIAIHTTKPEARYTEEATEGEVYQLIGQINLAHYESEKKATRLGAVWEFRKKQAREAGRIASGRGPSWLRKVGKGADAKWEEIPEVVASIRMMFELFPSLGRSRLATKLNEEAPWKPPPKRKGSAGGWGKSFIHKILTNPAVIGEYQPYTKRGGAKRKPDGDPITGYYPAIIERDCFFAVQARLAEYRGKGGATGTVSNIFSGLTRCAYCGGPVYIRDHGPAPKGGKYLRCEKAARRLDCPRKNRVPYKEVLEAILNNCASLNVNEVMPSESDAERLRAALRMKIRGGEKLLTELKAKIENLDNAISETPTKERRSRLQEKLDGIEGEAAAVEKQLAADKRALREAEAQRDAFKEWQGTITDLKDAIRKPEAVDVRLSLQNALKECIEKIEVFGDGSPEPEDPADIGLRRPFRADATSGHDSQRLFKLFCREVVARRMTSEGRFYRLHFKTGRALDIVPEGSIATGGIVDTGTGERVSTGVTGDGKRNASLPVQRLWDEFTKGERSKNKRSSVRGSK